MSVRGFINIDKPRGLTSFDVVRRIRRAAGVKRVGHAGTLDPNATGVLPIAVGEATRLVDELMEARKGYRGVIELGAATDTYDADGEVTAERDASGVTREDIERALAPFHGEIMQTPPAYSAVKREGVPAYRAARRGEAPELEPRPVTVHALHVLDVTGEGTPRPRITVDLLCSKGFYVRSLAHDLGVALGVGGYLAELARTAVGPFALEDAVSLDVAVALIEAGETETLVHAPDAVLLRWPAVILGSRQVVDVRMGRNVVAMPRPGYRAEGPLRTVRSYGPRGDLVALLEPGPTPGAWHPYRVFPAEGA